MGAVVENEFWASAWATNATTQRATAPTLATACLQRLIRKPSCETHATWVLGICGRRQEDSRRGTR